MFKGWCIIIYHIATTLLKRNKITLYWSFLGTRLRLPVSHPGQVITSLLKLEPPRNVKLLFKRMQKIINSVSQMRVNRLRWVTSLSQEDMSPSLCALWPQPRFWVLHGLPAWSLMHRWDLRRLARVTFLLWLQDVTHQCLLHFFFPSKVESYVITPKLAQ